MAIEVRIPTILRTYTDGAKAVEGAGGTLSALIDDLEGNHPGLKDRLVEDKSGSIDLRRFVNVYVGNEDVRFLEGLSTPVEDGSEISVGSCEPFCDSASWSKNSASIPSASLPRRSSSPASHAGATQVASSASATVSACSGRQAGRSSSVRRTPATIPFSGSSSSTGASDPLARSAPASRSDR